MKSCSKKIVKEGTQVLMCEVYKRDCDNSERAESFVQEAIEKTDLGTSILGIKRKSQTDWHYAGGMVVVKTLDSNPQLITDSLVSLLDKYEITNYM